MHSECRKERLPVHCVVDSPVHHVVDSPVHQVVYGLSVRRVGSGQKPHVPAVVFSVFCAKCGRCCICTVHHRPHSGVGYGLYPKRSELTSVHPFLGFVTSREVHVDMATCDV